MTDLLTTLVQKLDERTATFTDLDSASHKKRTPNRSLSERNGSLKPTPSERFEAESAHSVNGSQREPLLSVLYPVRQDRHTTDLPHLKDQAS
jgi:hypothetical protein